MAVSLSYGIGIPCHNEAQNIGQLLEIIQLSSNIECLPKKIVVMSSDSSDGTEEIVRSFSEKSRIPVVLRTEPKRRGKGAEILEGSIYILALFQKNRGVGDQGIWSVIESTKRSFLKENGLL